MKKIIITLSVVILAFSCKDKGKELKTGTEETFTAGLVNVDANTNYFATIVLKRTIKDSLKLIVVDSTDGKLTQEKRVVRDTSYIAWWGETVVDSLKNPIKSKVNPKLDSARWGWVPIKKEIVIHDFNKNIQPKQ